MFAYLYSSVPRIQPLNYKAASIRATCPEAHVLSLPVYHGDIGPCYPVSHHDSCKRSLRTAKSHKKASITPNLGCRIRLVQLSPTNLNLDSANPRPTVSRKMSRRKPGSKSTYRVIWRAPHSRFADESFRTIKAGDHRIIIACPRGEVHAGHCDVATKIEAVLHPKREHKNLNSPLVESG